MVDNAKVLIIDDEEVVLDSCTQILESGPYHVATALDGAFGLKLVQEFHPDLVFVDLKMPGISGLEVLDEIHAFDPTIVAIVITGYATVGSAVDAMKRGAYDFLPKPFTPDEFRVIAKRGLERRRLQLETLALRREKEMLREHFATIVSHELKAPLGAVQQNLYVLAHELSDQLTPDQQDRIERMKSRTDDLLKLIHTWLRVISVDVDNIRQTFKPTSVEAVVTKAIDSVEPHAVRKDVTIRTSVAEPLARVHGDEVTLVEALVNLLTNAVKFSHAGGRVHVAAEERGDSVWLTVADRGVGIAEEDLPFIFGDFYVGRTDSVAERGSGLGLAITRRIVEAHDGSISVESVPGKGSAFEIRLPAATRDQQLEATLEPGILAGSVNAEQGDMR